jgi:very-short-patch-repair endonuclease
MLTGTGATIGTARKLRKNLSLPEGLLWRELRKRPGGFKFRRQHPAGPFILDFVCLSARLAIEIDGAFHNYSIAQDEARDDWLMNQGFRTLRISAKDVLANLHGAMQLIIAECQPFHHPSDGPPSRSGKEF